MNTRDRQAQAAGFADAEAVIKAARDEYVDEGRVEIDADANMCGEETGVYVQAWVWVSAQG